MASARSLEWKWDQSQTMPVAVGQEATLQPRGPAPGGGHAAAHAPGLCLQLLPRPLEAAIVRAHQAPWGQ